MLQLLIVYVTLSLSWTCVMGIWMALDDYYKLKGPNPHLQQLNFTAKGWWILLVMTLPVINLVTIVLVLTAAPRHYRLRKLREQRHGISSVHRGRRS